MAGYTIDRLECEARDSPDPPLGRNPLSHLARQETPDRPGVELSRTRAARRWAQRARDARWEREDCSRTRPAHLVLVRESALLPIPNRTRAQERPARACATDPGAPLRLQPAGGPFSIGGDLRYDCALDPAIRGVSPSRPLLLSPRSRRARWTHAGVNPPYVTRTKPASWHADMMKARFDSRSATVVALWGQTVRVRSLACLSGGLAISAASYEEGSPTHGLCLRATNKPASAPEHHPANRRSSSGLSACRRPLLLITWRVSTDAKPRSRHTDRYTRATIASTPAPSTWPPRSSTDEAPPPHPPAPPALRPARQLLAVTTSPVWAPALLVAPASRTGPYVTSRDQYSVLASLAWSCASHCSLLSTPRRYPGILALHNTEPTRNPSTTP